MVLENTPPPSSHLEWAEFQILSSQAFPDAERIAKEMEAAWKVTGRPPREKCMETDYEFHENLAKAIALKKMGTVPESLAPWILENIHGIQTAICIVTSGELPGCFITNVPMSRLHRNCALWSRAYSMW